QLILHMSKSEIEQTIDRFSSVKYSRRRLFQLGIAAGASTLVVLPSTIDCTVGTLEVHQRREELVEKHQIPSDVQAQAEPYPDLRNKVIDLLRHDQEEEAQHLLTSDEYVQARKAKTTK